MAEQVITQEQAQREFRAIRDRAMLELDSMRATEVPLHTAVFYFGHHQRFIIKSCSDHDLCVTDVGQEKFMGFPVIWALHENHFGIGVDVYGKN